MSRSVDALTNAVINYLCYSRYLNVDLFRYIYMNVICKTSDTGNTEKIMSI